MVVVVPAGRCAGLTIAVYVVVSGGLGLVGDEAGDDCEGKKSH
jgi:hypothetical protein